MTSRGRIDGFAPLADYAVLGDGRTVALLARDGQVDWWPLPTLDGPPVVAGLLDPPLGGRFELAPVEAFDVERRYVPGTNVLESTFTTSGGAVRITAALNAGSAGRLPWTELAFRIEGAAGRVPMAWRMVPGNRFGRASAWIDEHRGTPIVRIADQTIAVVVDGLSSDDFRPHEVGGNGALDAGHRAIVGLVATDGEPVFIPDAQAVDARIDHTIASWRRWSDLLEEHGEWTGAVHRSALAIKTLLNKDTGAIAAAATTSLPERIGGPRNWDYRYAWIRDSSFTLDALIALGLHEEVQGAISWLLDATRRNGPDLHVCYTLAGALPDAEDELDVPGYRHSQPVRSGNRATSQSQLGNYGDLFDTILRYAREGHVIDPDTGHLLFDLADRCCDAWRSADSGIWELQDLEHYTISKIGCWVALDRAVALAEAGQLPAGRADRWAAEGDEIRSWIERFCWSEKRSSYAFHAGSDKLDAAVLLAARTGFDRGDRMVRTIEAIDEELGRGPLYFRFTDADEMEGTFVACTFWMVEALAYTGRHNQARELMTQAVTLTNDVGLLSEEVDPESGEFLGNLPQGLSHLALVNAATAIRRNQP